jgi:hypothetical protein
MINQINNRSYESSNQKQKLRTVESAAEVIKHIVVIRHTQRTSSDRLLSANCKELEFRHTRWIYRYVPILCDPTHGQHYFESHFDIFVTSPTYI